MKHTRNTERHIMKTQKNNTPLQHLYRQRLLIFAQSGELAPSQCMLPTRTEAYRQHLPGCKNFVIVKEERKIEME